MANAQKIRIIILLGPTASGKSAAAISLAQKFNGEIISADSRQIFRGMDIGTGKILKDFSVNQSSATGNQDAYFSEGIPHYAIDIADPNDDFNVTDFKKYTNRKIKEIQDRGKLPIICGGTGFWIKAVVDDVEFPKVAPNKELREELGQKDTEEIFAELEKLDPERAKNIDRYNKIRLIRAIEICNALGKVPKIRNQELGIRNQEFLQIGIKTEKEELHRKIQKRLDERFDQGMIEEVENLNINGVSWERLESFGLEYRRIAEYLQKKISKEKMEEKLYFDIIHYAKRQMTWFQRDKRIIWAKSRKEIESAVEKFLA